MLGGLEKMREAGCAVLGGHSVADPEIKFGYAVTGTVHPDRVKPNSGARPGDALVFTKAIGTGAIGTALERGLLTVRWTGPVDGEAELTVDEYAGNPEPTTTSVPAAPADAAAAPADVSAGVSDAAVPGDAAADAASDAAVPSRDGGTNTHRRRSERMSDEERRDSLADQAAAWVPPWSVPSRPNPTRKVVIRPKPPTRHPSRPPDLGSQGPLQGPFPPRSPKPRRILVRRRPLRGGSVPRSG